jgi:hypothetical protein
MELLKIAKIRPKELKLKAAITHAILISRKSLPRERG